MTTTSIRSVCMLLMLLAACAACDDYLGYGSDANEAEELKVRNYLGNYENIHPKVLHFDDGLWGHEFWMSYTPYPKGKTSAENPCIAVSDDGILWATPEGCNNPLATNSVLNGGYNSDSHIVARTDGSATQLECWYRPVKKIRGKFKDAIYRRVTTDGGRTWSEAEAVIDFGEWYDRFGNTLSPAVMYEDGRYRMWFVGTQGSSQQVWYAEVEADSVTSASAWTASRTQLDISWPEGKHPWHLDVAKSEGNTYEMAICLNDERGNGNAADLYYMATTDNEHFTTPRLIVKRSESDKTMDCQSIYRSSILRAHGRYYIYYSSIDSHQHRHLSLICGACLPSPDAQ